MNSEQSVLVPYLWYIDLNLAQEEKFRTSFAFYLLD